MLTSQYLFLALITAVCLSFPISSSSTYIRCASTIQSQKSDNNEMLQAEASRLACAKEKDSFVSWPTSTTDNENNVSILREVQPRKEAEKELYEYLQSNLMPFDIPNAESLGFRAQDKDHDHPLPDGLDHGIIGPTVSMAMDALQQYPWTKSVPKDVFFEYVGSFVSVNEARNNWRPLIHDTLFEKLVKPMLDIGESTGREGVTMTIEDIIKRINQNMWSMFNLNPDAKSIFFKSGQTPLIYDPMSIIAFGYASCTGLSIFLVDALRTFGIPARLAGTPAWNGKLENGNHSWIEFYGSDSKWHIMESRAASGGDDKDLLNPCQWWFCNKERTDDTSFYAARLDRKYSGGVFFPLAWDDSLIDVCGEDRTQFMRELCFEC